MCRVFTLLLVSIALINTRQSIADEGQPVAIRCWPDRSVTIETMQNQCFGLHVKDKQPAWRPRPLDAAVELAGPAAGQQAGMIVARIKIDHSGEGQTDQVLVSIAVDGLRILDVGDVSIDGLLNAVKLHPALLMPLKKIDVLLLNHLGPATERTQQLVEFLQPRVVVFPLAELPDEQTGSTSDIEIQKIAHNTVAVTAVEEPVDTQARWIGLSDQPWSMNDELTKLFQKKEAACRASRDVFKTMSVAQMNFKPANGTHTPRWNPEHMLGRELLFFSQIYHSVDPSIPVMNWNPKQMPPDYVAAHPDWTGAQEAEQMARVEAFTRRFAYLLEGLDLDKKPVDSRGKAVSVWTPRRLLKRMQGHYQEHTANVVKKTELPGWPVDGPADASPSSGSQSQ